MINPRNPIDSLEPILPMREPAGLSNDVSMKVCMPKINRAPFERNPFWASKKNLKLIMNESWHKSVLMSHC